MDKPSCDLAVALRIITMQSFYGATVAGLTAVGSGFGTTSRADRRRDVGIPSTIQIILYMWDDHVSFGNKNPASGYKLLSLIHISEPTRPISPNLVGVHSISRKKVS